MNGLPWALRRGGDGTRVVRKDDWIVGVGVLHLSHSLIFGALVMSGPWSDTVRRSPPRGVLCREDKRLLL